MAPTPPAPDDFPRLLSPIEAEAFRTEIWERRPLFIPGEPAKVARWSLDRTSFFHDLESRAAIADRIKLAFTDPTGRHREESIAPRLAKPMFDAGMTICVSRFDDGDPRLTQLAVSTKETLGHAGQVVVNIYVSPAGKGFGLHFDSQSVFIVQLDGRKRWQYSLQPGVPNPPENFAADADRAAEFRRAYPWADLVIPEVDTLTEQTLRPGDVLYLPAGTWHRAQAEELSIALTVTVAPFSARQLVLGVLDKVLTSDASWRQYLPLAPVPPEPLFALPAPMERFIAARLDELRRRIAELTEAELGIHWRTEVAARPPTAASNSATTAVTPSCRVRVRRPVELLDNPRGGTIALFAGGTGVELPADHRTFLRHLVQRSEFVACDAVQFCEHDEVLEWDGVREALELLVELGAVSITAAG